MGEVGGAIERIHTPTKTILFALRATFLGQHSDLRCCGFECLKHDAFGSKIGVGHQVAQASLVFNAGELSVMAHQFLTALIGSGAGYLSQSFQLALIKLSSNG